MPYVQWLYGKCDYLITGGMNIGGYKKNGTMIFAKVIPIYQLTSYTHVHMHTHINTQTHHKECMHKRTQNVFGGIRKP